MSTCSRCKGMIEWKRENGRSVPINADGSDHYDECKRLWWLMVKAEGKRFVEDKCSGYYFKGKRHLDRLWGHFTQRTNSRLPDCDCETPPWEHCTHTEIK